MKLKRNQDRPSKSETLVYLREKAEKDQELKLNEMLFMTWRIRTETNGSRKF